MKVKRGVVLDGLQVEMRIVLYIVDKVWNSFKQEAVITAGTAILDADGNFIHSVGSFHPFGLALDFRTRYFDRPTVDKIVFILKENLGDKYDVVKHKTHIHIEYDNR